MQADGLVNSELAPVLGRIAESLGEEAAQPEGGEPTQAQAACQGQTEWQRVSPLRACHHTTFVMRDLTLSTHHTPVVLCMLRAHSSRRVAPDWGGAQQSAQEALRAFQRGEYGAAALLLCSSVWAASSAQERACGLNNMGCIQARPLAG